MKKLLHIIVCFLFGCKKEKLQLAQLQIKPEGFDFSDFKDTGYDTQSTSISLPDQGIGCFFGMPTNLHEAVASEQKYLLTGKEEDGFDSIGDFKYIITNEAFTS